MKYLEFWFKTRIVNTIMQTIVVLIGGLIIPTVMYCTGPMGWPALMPMICATIFFMIELISYQYTLKSIEVDNTEPGQRTEEQRTTQSIARILDMLRLGFALSTLALFIVAVGIYYIVG